jgi:hypothetical protein
MVAWTLILVGIPLALGILLGGPYLPMQPVGDGPTYRLNVFTGSLALCVGSRCDPVNAPRGLGVYTVVGGGTHWRILRMIRITGSMVACEILECTVADPGVLGLLGADIRQTEPPPGFKRVPSP